MAESPALLAYLHAKKDLEVNLTDMFVVSIGSTFRFVSDKKLDSGFEWQKKIDTIKEPIKTTTQDYLLGVLMEKNGGRGILKIDMHTSSQWENMIEEEPSKIREVMAESKNHHGPNRQGQNLTFDEKKYLRDLVMVKWAGRSKCSSGTPVPAKNQTGMAVKSSTESQ